MKEQSLNIWNFNVYVTTGLEGGGGTDPHFSHWVGGGGGAIASEPGPLHPNHSCIGKPIQEDAFD